MWVQNFSQYVTLVTYHDSRLRLESLLVFFSSRCFCQEKVFCKYQKQAHRSFNILNKISTSKTENILWYNKRKIVTLKYNLYKLTRTQTCTRSFLSIVVEPFVFQLCLYFIGMVKYVCVRFYTVVTQLWRLYCSFTIYPVLKEKCQYYQICTGKYF